LGRESTVRFTVGEDRKQPICIRHISNIQLAKRHVRPALIIVPSPGLDLGTGIGQRQEPVGVQAFVA
jgi:hypothetical protein